MDSKKEINHLKYELELAQQKLNSSISSIKNFWSPELKKERLARKEEFFKYQQLQEKYKLLVHNEANSPTCSNKEINLLKKTLCELEIRIETQKQNITSKDETIKSLFSLLNSKDTLSSSNELLILKQFENDQKSLDLSNSAAFAAAEQRVNYLENQNLLLQEELKLYTSTINQTSKNQIDLFKSNEKYLKEKVSFYETYHALTLNYDYFGSLFNTYPI
jgi:ELKS/RAB6-interacting/CAST family member 2